MMHRDLHTHTCYCDGRDTPEQMVLSAIDKGLKTIGILAHSPTIIFSEHSMKTEMESAFKAEVRALKEKYKDKINVLCGIEQDYYSDHAAEGYDYIIGGMHFFKVNGKYYHVDYTAEYYQDMVKNFFGGDYYSAAECYYETLSDIVEKTNADIIAHFDLVGKFNEGNVLFDTEHPRYVRAYTSAIEQLIKHKKPFEINTGAISRGYRTEPYPLDKMIKKIKQLGGKFVLSSDAHAAENVAFEFDKWQKLL